MVTQEVYNRAISRYGENLYKPVSGFPPARRLEVTNGQKRKRRRKAKHAKQPHRKKGRKVQLPRVRPKVRSSDQYGTYFNIGAY